MELLYRGFDGLDVSFQARLPSDLCRELEDAKNAARETHSKTPINWKGVWLFVSESGARGGYAFCANTGEFGATWFFKRPNTRDPWGVRVSCGSFQLALNGLAGTKAALNETMTKLGLRVTEGQESIGRVDYALDFLAPDFELVPSAFVMHSNSSRADHSESYDISTHGASGRITSVTVGKMPGRQVIVYDKRAEIIAHNKTGWLEIWNAGRAKNEQPRLALQEASTSRVWRVELRAGKKFLKDRWRVTTWSELVSRYGDVVAATLAAVRHTEPSSDSNRSRWPNSELWKSVERLCDADLFEMRNYADPDLVKAVQREAFSEMLSRQMDGLLVTRAGVEGIPLDGLPEFAASNGAQMANRFRQEAGHFAKKHMAAAARYTLIGSGS